MSTKFTRRAPSGHVVGLEWPTRKLSSEVTGVRFAGSKYGRAFQIGTRGYHDDACRMLLESTTSKAIRVGRREVRLATAKDGASSIATLIGEYHEMMTVFSGPAPTEETIAGLFSVFDIADTTEGLVARPTAATLLTTLNENVMLVNDHFDSVDVPGPAFAKANLPKGKGARSGRGGEVWRRQLPNTQGKAARDYAYTLGFPSAIGQVMPGPATTEATDQHLLEWVDGMAISWTKD